jgi:hypothetical protein
MKQGPFCAEGRGLLTIFHYWRKRRHMTKEGVIGSHGEPLLSTEGIYLAFPFGELSPRSFSRCTGPERFGVLVPKTLPVGIGGGVTCGVTLVVPLGGSTWKVPLGQRELHRARPVAPQPPDGESIAKFFHGTLPLD